jgi:hypothetical protein
MDTAHTDRVDRDTDSQHDIRLAMDTLYPVEDTLHCRVDTDTDCQDNVDTAVPAAAVAADIANVVEPVDMVAPALGQVDTPALAARPPDMAVRAASLSHALYA